MNMPLELCEQRDAKGLYKLARAGKIKGSFTKVSYMQLWFDDNCRLRAMVFPKKKEKRNRV